MVVSLPCLFTIRSLSTSPLLSVGWVDLNIGNSLFGEKEQARLLVGEQLPCVLLALLDRLTLAGLLLAVLKVV